MNITAGKFKGRKVIVPDEKIVRPTLSKAREGIFNVLFSIIDFENKTFLDMFAGSGIMGLEALSRGFEKVVAVEKNIKVVKILKENYNKIGLKENLIVGDCLKKKISEQFDVIYIDPPYFSGIYEQVLEKIQNENLLAKDGIIILEHVVDVDFQGFSVLKQKSYSNKTITFLKQ